MNNRWRPSPTRVLIMLGTALVIAFVLAIVADYFGLNLFQEAGGKIARAQEVDHRLVVVRVTRLPQNPLVTVDSSPTLGKNVNGPTVIRVPDWVQRPLGRYYMYFANHRGDFIRLAYADAVTGPWTIHEPGVLHARDTAFYRPQPDVMTQGGFSTHLASPEILVDDARRRIVMWTHGWFSNGERWPDTFAAARAWANEKGYGQYTQAAESTDGLHFTSRPAITKESYLRVFRHAGGFYAMSRLGQLSRANDPLASFEIGGNPFGDTPYANRVRHVALVPKGNTLQVLFTAIGDAPERVMFTTIDLTKDWTTWRVTPPIEVMRPETDYECGSAPTVPSEVGDVDGRVRQIRDPYVLDDRGRTYLFYAICGEQGVAVAEISLP